MEKILGIMTAIARPWVLETARLVVDPVVRFALGIVKVGAFARLEDADWGNRHQGRMVCPCSCFSNICESVDDVCLPRSRFAD